MRSFFASFFGTLAALALLASAAVITTALLLNSLSTGREVPAAVQPGSYLVLDLSDHVQDAPLQNQGLENLAEMFGDDDARVLQTRQVTRALQAAASDGDIAGLYLSGQNPTLARASGFAALKEVRDAIGGFRAAGKPVKAWLNFAGTREYYLASAADEVVLDPFGAILLPGLATQPMFYAGAFEKFGIGVQVTRVGRYKSAVEPYTRRDMSPESRAQTQHLLDDLWSEIQGSIEASRKLPERSLQQTVDSEGLIRAESASRRHLVDRIAYLDEILEELRAATGTRASRGSFKQISIADYAKLVSPASLLARRRGEDEPAPAGHEKIAIVYAEGAIVDGTGSDETMVWGDKLARDLRQARRDTSVKAVVLRVNSPGGSVSASETIQREMRLIKATKPVAVSMGSVAASGGYWISTYSDRIFAEPTTITGSIGVFGILFNVQQLATEKLGLTFETVKTGRFADAATITRPKTEDELAIIQASVDWIYDQFLSKVAESRRLDPKTVGEIAQGRVWSGTEAARIGLVDEIGGLESAVAWAAGKASVGDEFSVVEYPRGRKWTEALGDALGNKRREKAAEGLAGEIARELFEGFAAISEYNDPRGLYARLPFDLRMR